MARPGNEFKVNNFDLLRILAALQVVLAHSVAHLHIPHPPFWSLVDAFPGVPIFFAISGFLISASFERTPNLASYVRNRILRIYPALWCVVLVTVVVASLFGYNFLSLSGLFWLACQLVGLIYTPHFLKSFGFGSYNGALWTIPIELQFYLLLPAFYLGGARLAKHRTTIFLVAWVVFVAVAYVYALKSPPLAENVVEPLGQKLFRYSFIPHIYMFLTGAVLQRWHAQRSPWIVGKGPYWVGAYLLAHFLLPGAALNYVVGTLLMAIATVSLAYTAPRLSQTLLRGNDISYGVYIYHGLILNILIERGLGGRLWYLPLVVVLTLIAGWLSWRFVERPFLRRKRQTIHALAVEPAR
jgi:peptidoglycan/LPS O-acetylase OafA/YrhL